MKCVIRTFTGREVNPLDLRPEDIDIRDIAHALACVNRFAGQAKYPVSVAQHSVYVSRLVTPREPEEYRERSSILTLAGLLHDAPEAYLGDVTKWLKNTPAMAGYREAEARAESVIAEAFGLPALMTPEIEEADRIMVRFEGARSFPSFVIEHPNYPPLTAEQLARVGKWKPWSWREAKEAFLTQYRCLRGGVA